MFAILQTLPGKGRMTRTVKIRQKSWGTSIWKVYCQVSVKFILCPCQTGMDFPLHAILKASYPIVDAHGLIPAVVGCR